MKQLTFLVFTLFTAVLFGQTKVSGVIKDANGEPIAFANVIFKNSNEGTISNEDGRFYLESDKDYEIVSFSFLGFNTLDVTLEQKSTYKMVVLLLEEAAALSEVVVSRGKQSKKNNPAIDILKKYGKIDAKMVLKSFSSILTTNTKN
jgi:hypothetical protein